MRQSLLEPLFYMNGRPVFPVMGGATDEDPFPSDERDEDETEDSEAGGAGSDEDSEDVDEKPSNPKDARIKELSQENAKRRAKNKELQAQLDKLQKDLKQFTDKDKSEVEKTSERARELETAYEELAVKYEALRKRNAVLSQTKYQFKNPDLAMKLVDLDGVEFDDDGTASGLDKVLDALKKSDPYLFKDGTEGSSSEEQPPKTGEAPQRKDKATVNREALLKKYPALQR